MEIQTDLFKSYDQCQIEALKEELAMVKRSSDKVRRGIFARHNELSKHYLELKQEMEDWKRSVCRGTLTGPHVLREVI